MSVNDEFNNNIFRFRMPTNQVAAGNLRPIWNVGAIQSINLEQNLTPSDNDIIYYDASSRSWKTGSSPNIPVSSLPDGTAAAPSVAFADDTNTGIYRVGTDNIGFTTDGTLRVNISSTSMTSALPVYVNNGTDSNPSIAFTNDTNTGIYLAGSDNIGFTTGGTLRFDISTTGITSTLPIYINNGTESNPSITFTNDTNSGIYLAGSDNIGFSTDGTLRFDISSTDITSTLPVNLSELEFIGETGVNNIIAPDNVDEALTISNQSLSRFVTIVTNDVFQQVQIMKALVTDNIYIAKITQSSGPDAIPVITQIHEITTTGTGDALSLDNGIIGQIIKIVYVAQSAGTDTAIVTPTVLAGGTTITFNNIGESAELICTSNSSWHVISLYGAVVA